MRCARRMIDNGRQLQICTLFAAFLAGGVAGAQSVTFGGPVLGGLTTQLGGVVSSTPLNNIANPGGIATNKLGTFYITDETGSAVYAYLPPSPGSTGNYSKLNFTGLNSPRGIAVDASGNIYVADYGNNRVVRLPAGGTAAQQTTVFSSSEIPQMGGPLSVAVDSSGNLFVSASPLAYNNTGGVFKVPAGTQSPTQIGSGFYDPQGIAVDGSGNLYIADSQNDRIVKLAPNGSQSTVVSNLNDPSAIAVDNAGNLFFDGAFGYPAELKVGSTEQIAVLPDLIGRYSGYAVDGNDNLFAVTLSTPTFYESSTGVISLPQASVCQPSGNSSASCSSTISVVFWIWNSVNLGTPRILTQGESGLDFTDGGSAQYSDQQGIPQPCAAGSIVLSSGESQECSVTVKFAPLSAGPRSGAIQIVDSDGNVLVQLMLYGLGLGPQLSIYPVGAPLVTASIPVQRLYDVVDYGLPVGVDAAGNLYISDDATVGGTNQSQIYKISSSGSQTNIPISNVFEPGRVEIDGAGNLFVPAEYADYEFPPQGSNSATAPITLAGNFHGDTGGIALDGHGDADLVNTNIGSDTSIVYRATQDGSLLQFATVNGQLGDIVNDPWLMEADTSGHYDGPVAAEGNDLELISPLDQSASLFLNLQTVNTNFNIPLGPGTFDIGPGGNFYLDVPSGITDLAGAMPPTAQYISGPLAVDRYGNVFVGTAQSSPEWSITEIPAVQQPFTFAKTSVGSASPTQVFHVFNGGNAAMNFTTVGASGPFAVAQGQTTCSTTTPVSPVSSCSIAVVFTPTTAGNVSGNLTIAVAGLATPTFSLSGTGIAPLASTSTTLTITPNPATAGATVSFMVEVTSGGSSPTGKVTINDGSTTIATVSLNSGSASYSTSTLAAGTHSITATYSGDTANQPSTSAAVNLTIAPISVQIATSSPLTISPGGSVTANVAVGSVSNYAGTVALSCLVALQGQGSATDLPGCTVNPANMTLSAGSSQTATLTVTTTSQSTSANALHTAGIALCGAGMGSILVICFARIRRSGWTLLLFLLVVQIALAGCGPSPPPQTKTPPQGNPGTSTGSYIVTLSSTAGSVTTGQSFTITVQ